MLRLLLSSLLLLLAVGCKKPNGQATVADKAGDVAPVLRVVLTDITAESGVDFTYRNGQEAGIFSIVESLGGGVGIADFDRDGWSDLFFPGGGEFKRGEPLAGLPHGLFRQVALLEFQEVGVPACIHDSARYSHGCAIADFDNDGFPDVLVTGYGGLELFKNQGDGTFLESRVAACLHDLQWSSSAAWGDLNADGDLDLYVAHYANWSWDNNPKCFARPGQLDICPPRTFLGLDDTLYMSNGDGTFDDATRESGLVPEGKGLGVTIADLDGDGDADVYVANDTVDNFFYLNRGSAKFDEAGTRSGLATDDRGAPNGSMGVAVLDYDANGLPDVWVANYENESFALYRNEGDASFTHVSQAAGIYALGSSYVGFGTVACDIDKDGDEDLIVSNGHVVKFPRSGSVKQKPVLLLNENGSFQIAEFSASDYFAQMHHGRGLAVGDLDNDGDLDMAFSNNNEPAAVLKNDIVPSGKWLGVRLIGQRSNRDAIGARVLLHTTNGKQYRAVVGGGSYLSQSDMRLNWGISQNATAKRLEITWPSGVRQDVPLDQINRYINIIEPRD